MRNLLRVALVLFAASSTFGAVPTSTRNNDSCDIGLYPAATLLLPYFEVDLFSPAGAGETTLFTVTNVTNKEQIAHVTLWTDHAYPVISFDLYLTGYDTQSINLRDVFEGRIAPPNGTGAGRTDRGEYSDPNPTLNLANCANLPTSIPPVTVAQMQRAFIIGRTSIPNACENVNVGDVHVNAIGYATIDVVGSCGFLTPADSAYYTSTLRFENVFVGDYQQVNGAQNNAQGGPLVHIRAMPEDGEVNFPRTFYGRFQSAAQPKRDRRQPLPSTFAARWINGGPGDFNTSLKIWREARSGADAPCSSYGNNRTPINEVVRFDEEENAIGNTPCPLCDPPIFQEFESANAFRERVDSGFFISTLDGDVAGWMYLNLDTFEAAPAQAWVISSMTAEGRYSADSDALAMGNGCTPRIENTEITVGTTPLGPAGNVNP
jgi:hypothetical protein